MGPNASIVNRARDGSRLLVSTEGASDPGTWYVYTAATHDLKEFVQIRPNIDPAMLAEVRPVTYTARDGTSIRAHQKAAGAAVKTPLRRNGARVRRLAALVAAMAPRPA